MGTDVNRASAADDLAENGSPPAAGAAGLIRLIERLVGDIAAIQEERSAEAARLARIRLASPHFAKRQRKARSAEPSILRAA